MKKVLVIGAHGRTGHLIIERLLTTAWQPIAGVRSAESQQIFIDQGIDARLLDVRATIIDIQQQLAGIDAIIYAAGGGMMVDLDGKVKVAQAAELAGIKRFLLISAGGIQHFHDPDRLQWMNEWEEYSAAMYYGDMYILNSQLDYTIIRPEHLVDTVGNSLVNVGPYLPHHDISRANVAAITVGSLLDAHTIRMAFDVENGRDPINVALAQITEENK